MNVVVKTGIPPVGASELLFAGALFPLVGRFPPPNAVMGYDIRTLFQGLPFELIVGDPRTVVHSLSRDSRRIAPGSLFFALRGLRTDGNQYIGEAAERGATAVVSDREVPVPNGLALILGSNVRRAMAEVARRFYGQPQKSIDLIGVTGTNGKTTVAYLLHFLLHRADRPAGMLGTVKYVVGTRTLSAYCTTPESLELYALMAQMRDAGCRRTVMEVSSHGIDQDRVDGLHFAIAAFLNLTMDHLDYHGSAERYFQTKCRLFNGSAGPPPGTVVLNRDDPYGRRLCRLIPSSSRLITFGFTSGSDFWPDRIALHDQGAAFDMHTPEGIFPVETRLLGRYNVANLLAATAIAFAAGSAPEPTIERLASFPGVLGRMEPVDAGQPFKVLVDYAHTDDALRNALSMLRAITRGRLLAVFGCGGNRDHAKRPMMTRAVLDYCDYAWATADNPREEAVVDIFRDMQADLTGTEPIEFVADRRRAIGLALAAAQDRDCVLIAGKGHETSQEFSRTVVPFDDRKVARELLRNRIGTGDGEL